MCEKCNGDGPTKEDLIAGVLTVFKMGALSEELTIGEIQRFAQDSRVNWKNPTRFLEVKTN